MSSLPSQFAGVTVLTKANIYFDGNVVSHTVLMPNNAKKTLGLIRPGSYYFKTGAAERMDGGDPTVGSAFAAAWARAGRLLQWAVLATVVSIVVNQLEERFGILGRIVAWIGSVAWGVMSFLALPVLLFEDVGAIEAFKRSSALVKRTWGEQVTFNFGLGLLGFLAVVPGVLVGGLLMATGLAPLVVVGVVGLVGWIVLVATVTSAVSAVFKAALYRWANGLPVDPAFDAGELTSAFRRR